MIEIRLWKPAEIPKLVPAFRQSVAQINSSVYSAAQRQVWSNGARQIPTRLKGQLGWIALDADMIVGFSDLTTQGLLDYLYVLPTYQRQGIGSRLINSAVGAAQEMQLPQVTTEASKIARPLFERTGFILVTEQTVVRQDLQLVNYVMKRVLKGGGNNES